MGIGERGERRPGARPERPAAGELHRSLDREPRARCLAVVAAGAHVGQDGQRIPRVHAILQIGLKHRGAAADAQPERAPLGGIGIREPLLAGDGVPLLEVADRRRDLRLEPPEGRAQVVAHRYVEVGGGDGRQ